VAVRWGVLKHCESLCTGWRVVHTPARWGTGRKARLGPGDPSKVRLRRAVFENTCARGEDIGYRIAPYISSIASSHQTDSAAPQGPSFQCYKVAAALRVQNGRHLAASPACGALLREPIILPGPEGG
jgi:hypothetical protein